MFIEFSEWIDDQTFVCNFGVRCDDGGDWFELVGEYQKDKNRFCFERIYDDCVLAVTNESRKMMMRAAMIEAMKD